MTTDNSSRGAARRHNTATIIRTGRNYGTLGIVFDVEKDAIYSRRLREGAQAVGEPTTSRISETQQCFNVVHVVYSYFSRCYSSLRLIKFCVNVHWLI